MKKGKTLLMCPCCKLVDAHVVVGTHLQVDGTRLRRRLCECGETFFTLMSSEYVIHGVRHALRWKYEHVDRQLFPENKNIYKTNDNSMD